MAATWNDRVDQGSSMSVDLIKAALGDSPLAPYAQRIADDGAKYNVDPALFLAIAKFESDYGRAASSIYNRATGQGSFNWTSISNAAYGGSAVAGSRWGQYPDPQTGIDAFFKLITTEYYPNGQNTIGSIMWGVGGSSTVSGTHAYAPASENSIAYYTNFIQYLGAINTSTITVNIPLVGPVTFPAAAPGTPNPPTLGNLGEQAQQLEARVPSGVGDTLAGVVGAANGIAQSISNLGIIFGSSLDQLKAVGEFLGQPNLVKRFLLLVGGVLVAIVGLILFAISFVHLPGGARVG